jgi:pimeloyl-ACP methyl ester carboxylesterase
MASFVVAHGAWSAGWAWRRMHAELGGRGHRLSTPTWTGIGERRHLASSAVTLSTHIDDLVMHMETEDHSDVVLLAHSYGGMVATGAMLRIADRVRQVIYLDAVLPGRGQSMLDLIAPVAREAIIAATDEHGDGWRVPSNPPPSDTSEEDLAWIMPRRVAQPIGTFSEGCPAGVEEVRVPAAYIYCTRIGPGDMFGPFAASARRLGWPTVDIDASHSPNITAPSLLADTLEALLADG